MFEKIKPYGKPQKSGKLYLLLAVCVLLLVLFAGVIAWSFLHFSEFRKFVSDFSNSTVYAYENNCMTAVTEDGEFRIWRDNIYTIYNAITNAGSGRSSTPLSEPPEAVLYFGDGSYMELWNVTLKNDANDRKHGLLISFINQEGWRYTYDTDRLDVDILPLAPSENPPKKMK